MSKIIILKGGVPDNNFNIQKWTAENRGNETNQYNPRYKEISLLETQNPLNNIGQAKRVIREWYDKREIYLKFKKQGRILSGVQGQLIEKEIID